MMVNQCRHRHNTKRRHGRCYSKLYPIVGHGAYIAITLPWYSREPHDVEGVAAFRFTIRQRS